jgi:hypothetical protein
MVLIYSPAHKEKEENTSIQIGLLIPVDNEGTIKKIYMS